MIEQWNGASGKAAGEAAGSAASPWAPAHGTWSSALSQPARAMGLAWRGAGEAFFGPLPGWRGPLWRIERGGLELLRPEGRWRGELGGARAAFALRQEGADGWLSRRSIMVHPEAEGRGWFDQHGIAQSPAALDEEAIAPAELAGLAHARGEWARWELTPEGKAMGWLDDSFEAGPFSVRDRNPYLVVSNGDRKVAYWMGPSHWAWPMVGRGMLLLSTGRGGGWEPERCYSPILI